MLERKEIDYLTEQLRAVMLNKPIPPELKVSSEELQELQGAVEYISKSIAEVQEFLGSLCEGKLNISIPGRHNFIANYLKELHSILRHLTWQTEQVAKGDYSQRVRFLGEFSDSFNILTAQLREREESIAAKTEALTKSMNLLKVVLDAQQDWVVVTDAENNQVIYLNQSAKYNFYDPDTSTYIGGYGEELMKKLITEFDKGNANETNDDTSVYGMGSLFFSIRSFPMEWENRKAFVHCIGDVTDAQEEKEQLQDMAFRDSLTVAYNRRYCMKKIQTIIEQKTECAVVLVDLDELKQVNDVQGHLQGDDYLITVANGINTSLRTRDKLCRMGGDEFIILMPNCTEENAVKKLEMISSKLKEIDRPYKIQISYGVVFIDGIKNPTIEKLLKMVDERMYHMKQIHKKATI